MATRVTPDPQLSLINETDRIRRLRRRAGKREGLSNYIGLRRSSALSDVDSPVASLNNILDKISLIEDAGERNLYGRPYNALDWNVTKDFISQDIDKSFLSQLNNTSVGGGVLGSTVSTTPRIRIQDRISLLNSFYGEGSFPGLHSGPSAQFYRNPGSDIIGRIKFTISGSTVTVTEIKAPDGLTNLTTSDILNGSEKVVLDLDNYETPDGVIASLTGANLSLLLESPSSWSALGLSTSTGLESIKEVVGESVFGNLKFKISRLVSKLNPPDWFTESPSDPVASDDNNPATSSKVLVSRRGGISPLVERGYWFTREYVETRWTNAERTLVGKNNVTQDSNMRWREPPLPLRGEEFNWGVRWDGYLRLTPGTYAFLVQTNVSVRIDMDVDGWTDVFNTQTAAQENEDTYISAQSFSTGDLDDKYKYFTGDNLATDWVAYVPVTVRMFHGGPDKSQPELVIPAEPNLFIKTTSITSARSWYSEDFEVSLAGTDGDWTLSGADVTSLKAILEDTAASAQYLLISKDGQFFDTPEEIALSISGSDVVSDTTGLTSGNYVLSVLPVRGSGFGANLEALWRGRIASPSVTSSTYTDLTDSGYTPDFLRIPFDERPPWWKISDGSPFNRGDDPTTTNTLLDGFVRNTFKPVLESDVDGVGLYGDGADPVTYSSRPNIILGEVRYSEEDPLGSNYISIRLEPNSLGQGGLLIVDSLPSNNSTFDDSILLGANDLGGTPNHLTGSSGKPVARIAQLHLAEDDTEVETYNKYFLHADLTVLSEDDDPEVYGFPAFSSSQWLSPITILAVRVADNEEFDTNVKSFVDILVLSVERLEVDGYNVLAFSTSLESILDEGTEVSQFNGKYVEYYTESSVDYPYQKVDTGASLSFADVLKITYDGSDNLVPAESEIPRPPSDRVTPWGFDRPEFGSGLCYPPYATVNTLLADTAVSDEDLYTAPTGNYDVIWGDITKPQLGGKVLRVLEKLEFSGDPGAVEVVSPPVNLTAKSYTHRVKVNFPLDSSAYDEDALEFIGNGETVKDSYYLYINLDS
jgi:hypothetical protein